MATNQCPFCKLHTLKLVTSYYKTDLLQVNCINCGGQTLVKDINDDLEKAAWFHPFDTEVGREVIRKLATEPFKVDQWGDFFTLDDLRPGALVSYRRREVQSRIRGSKANLLVEDDPEGS